MKEEIRERNMRIIRCSLIGVGMNLLLSVIKIVAGSVAHAHAIMMDGINSLSDMTASVISILSSIITSRRGNRNHPFGYGRLEYLSSLLITMIILYFGIRSVIESVLTIIHPDSPPDYSPMTVAVVVISLVCKMAYGLFMQKKGKSLKSDALIMSGFESMGDALVSVGILAAMLLLRLTGIDIEHYVCIAISLLIIWTGIQMIHDSGTKMLGTRPDPKLREQLIRQVVDEEQVLNISNIMLHNYGEGRYVGSVDVEVEGGMTASESTRLTRRIIRRAEGLGITLTSVGICGTDITDPDAMKAWDEIISMARKYKSIRRVSSFFIDPDSHDLSFYVTQNLETNRQTAARELRAFTQSVHEAFPEMHVDIHLGIDA